MASLTERYGKWALVAGAAEGLGEGFCTVLAASGFNIILADRNAAAMHTLATRMEKEYAIETLEVHVDLADADAVKKCMEPANRTGCRLLVYVAGWSRVCRFTELDPSELDGFLSVNTRTLLHLVHGFSKRPVPGGKRGGILLVSSLAGLIGPQYVATYAATKAFSIRLAEALHHELQQQDIDITACCSGTVSTPTYWKSKPSFDRMKPLVMESVDVAAYALNKLGKRVTCIPGLTNRLQYFLLMNLMPLRQARRLVNSAMKKMYWSED